MPDRIKTASKQLFAQSRWTIPEVALISTAILSLVYAVVTAPGKGIDLGFFQTGAREWVDGVFQIGKGVIGVYTPFMLPLFSPIALLSTARS